MSSPPLKALRVFETVARTGSFRAAAEVLCVTQSAVSHQIRHLEDWLGAPLFEREGNRTRLLPHASELSRSLSLSLAEIDTACQRARVNEHNESLVIAAIPSVAMCWLIPRLTGFRQAHPDIETQMLYAMHGRDINFRKAHIAFVFAPKPPDLPGIETHYFLPGTSVPVCSPSLIGQSSKTTLSPAKIVELGLLHDIGTTGWQTWIDQVGLQISTPLTGALFEDFNLLRAAALSGQGVALCASSMIQPDLEAERFVQLSDVSVLKEHAYYMLIRPHAQAKMMQKVQSFRDWAMDARGT
ncbi:Glycine cleavage system transcriptional activator [Roseobacter fucihabitans]|uniref:Glycine cleavage system transcriptional activator n=1 Tax=Roseobacter fucihabitans TaxID=1537242 RepID=A0ABZ2BNJ1_9RHOB|nr:LysR family transcriptional regulator [Roseobacter litoralis]MBC6966275.1 Glycine cleavage system transcriptional activator [Roseobacter litoralis]